MLFVPADNERKLAKSLGSSADALILDLEDAVAAGRKPMARKLAAAHLADTRQTRRWKGFVRINPLTTPESMQDLVAIVAPGLDGIVLPKADGAEDVIRLGHYLDALEVAAGLSPLSIRIVVVATETAKAVLNMSSYGQTSARLEGLTWGAEDLSLALGASTNREADGSFSHAYLMARSMCLMAAGVAGVAPIDTLYAKYDDLIGLEQDCYASARRGFVGRIAIHPDQVDIINRGYTPTSEDLATARAIVEAFAANPDVGTIGIDNRMYDRPHLLQSMRKLAQVGSDN